GRGGGWGPRSASCRGACWLPRDTNAWRACCCRMRVSARSCGSTAAERDLDVIEHDLSERDLGPLTDDAVLGGRLLLRQPARGHRVGHDAILLAASTAARRGEVAVDLGAGIGAAGLVLAQRVPGLSVRLIEIDAALAALAAENAARNGLAPRVSAHALDVTGNVEDFVAAGLAVGGSDRVLMNPPFHGSRRAQASPDARRRLAHLAPEGALAAWIATAAW